MGNYSLPTSASSNRWNKVVFVPAGTPYEIVPSTESNEALSEVIGFVTMPLGEYMFNFGYYLSFQVDDRYNTSKMVKNENDFTTHVEDTGAWKACLRRWAETSKAHFWNRTNKRVFYRMWDHIYYHPDYKNCLAGIIHHPLA